MLGVINAIRAPGDGLEQVRGRTITVDGIEQPVAGTSNLFILPADAERSARLAAIRQWLAAETGDGLWLSDVREGDVRLLVLVHRMAANRLGLLRLDDRFAMHLAAEPVDDGSSGFENVQAYLACGVDELWA